MEFLGDLLREGIAGYRRGEDTRKGEQGRWFQAVWRLNPPLSTHVSG
jgi:hypothetical protein